MIPQTANYHLPRIGTREDQRCRNCAEARKSGQYGNNIGCRLHGVSFVRYSHRCDAWHARGTLL